MENDKAYVIGFNERLYVTATDEMSVTYSPNKSYAKVMTYDECLKVLKFVTENQEIIAQYPNGCPMKFSCQIERIQK